MNKLIFITLLTGLLFFSMTQAEESAGISNRVKWVTASELNNFGFDVFRGDCEKGPFVRINNDTIPGAGSVDTPTEYEYIDYTIEKAKAYWYYVESISMSGQRQKFTPTFQSPPRLPTTEQ